MGKVLDWVTMEQTLISLRKWRKLYQCKRKENSGRRRSQKNIWAGGKLCVALLEMVWIPVRLGKEKEKRKALGQVRENSKLRI